MTWVQLIQVVGMAAGKLWGDHPWYRFPWDALEDAWSSASTPAAPRLESQPSWPYP